MVGPTPSGDSSVKSPKTKRGDSATGSSGTSGSGAYASARGGSAKSHHSGKEHKSGGGSSEGGKELVPDSPDASDPPPVEKAVTVADLKEGSDSKTESEGNKK